MERPNILIITLHDLGRHLNCYGIETVVSPEIDHLGETGVRFANAFSSAPTCSPSRAALFTGCYPHNNGVMGLTHSIFQWDLDPSVRHLASYLKDAGYSTAVVRVAHETGHPERVGYGEVVQQGLGACESVAAAVTGMLDNRQHAREPWLISVGFQETHRPFDYGGALPDDVRGVTVPRYLVEEPSARAEFAAFQGLIRKADQAIGVILRHLEKRRMDKNTIVLLTADHGIPFPRAKCTLYDPGIEIALLARWPEGGWCGGRVVDHLVSNLDVTPSLLEAVGIPIPDSVQGRSFFPALLGVLYQPRTEVFAEQTYHGGFDPRRCIRTRNAKLMANFCATRAVFNSTETWRPATITRTPADPMRGPGVRCAHLELYDLDSDPLETANLATSSGHDELLNAMKARLLAWMRSTEDPLLHGVPMAPMHRRTLEMLLS
jgi:N-sulfoglucosamine sulfohydrolase